MEIENTTSTALKMQYCPKCKVDIRGNKECCPLCGGRLSGEPGEEAFPALRVAVSRLNLASFATFLFLVAEIVMFATWYLAKHEKGIELSWTILVNIGAFVAWVDFLIALYLKNNLLNIVTFEVFIAMILDYIVDRMTGYHGWSVQWMIPMTFVGMALFILVIALIGRMRTEDYIVHLLIFFITDFIQIIPILTGSNTFLWPAVLCITFYMILAAALFAFRRRELTTASAKYFNV